MSRALQTIVLDLELTPELYELYDEAEAPGELEASDAVAWHLASPTTDVWATSSRGDAEHLTAIASLVEGADGYELDSAFESERWAMTPTIAPASVRAWQAIELWYDAPTGTAVWFRLNDGTDDLWWDGAAWSVAGAGEWNTAAEVREHFADMPATARSLAVKAWLSTTTATAAPWFGGARIAFGLRELDGDEGDALVHTLCKAIRDEVRGVEITEFTTTATETTEIELAPEMAYEVTGVTAVFNLTDDPLEASPLDGTFAAGTNVRANRAGVTTPATWTATTPIASGKRIRLEWAYRPHTVVQLHRDAVEIDRLPAIYLGDAGTPRIVRGQGEILVRDVGAEVPTADALAAPSLVEQEIDVRVIGEFARDVRQIMRRLQAFFGGSGYRTLVSPESARLITVAEVQGFRTTTESLAAGTPEARATWRLTYHTAAADALISRTLIRDGGVATTLEE